MENVTRAFIMAFSMLIFVIAFSYSMYLINKLTTTSNTLLESVTTTNYYDNIEVSGDITTRDVGIETIIPTLYRYYKENYAVKIIDNAGNVIQLFDLAIESKMPSAASNTNINNKELESLKKSIYNNKGNPYTPSAGNVEKAYMFGAPWTGRKDDQKARIDYFLHGINGYINDSPVNYKDTIGDEGFIGKYGGSTFEESFVEYAYEGETISTENGLETITGSTQENSKIIITYTEQP